MFGTNKGDKKHRFEIKPFLVYLYSILLIVFYASYAHAEKADIGIFLGDWQSRICIDAIKEIKKSHPQLDSKINFNIFTSKNLANKALPEHKPKTIFILHTMDSKLAEKALPYVLAIIANGGKVYAVGGSFSKDNKEAGMINDEIINSYQKEGGIENIKNMLLFIINRDLGIDITYEKPKPIADFGIYLKSKKGTFETYEDFLRNYQVKKDKPWIGITLFKNYIDSGNTATVDMLIDYLENKGFNVLTVYGFPSEKAVEKFFFDEKGNARVSLVIGLSMKVGVNPQTVIPVLSRLGVPVINAIGLYTQSSEEWEKSPIGLDIFERGWQVALPEMGGLIQPTVISSKERLTDKETGIEYIEDIPIPERVKRLIERIKAWINLQEKPNKDKKIALIYYNYPPGKQNIGASYLNVLPESLWEILQRLKAEGYRLKAEGSELKDAQDLRLKADEITKEQLFNDIHNYGRNIGNWAGGEIDSLARSGKAVLIPVETYRGWLNQFPEGFRKDVIKSWGEPDKTNIMTWQGASGTKYIIIPVVRYGNILLTVQPSRAWEQDVSKMYHDVILPPHHQYIAFYLWLKNEFKADAIAHIGTHGTHEWLSGKEVGFTEEDPPEVLIQDMPNIYPYIVDNVGEGTQAKRRGMAVIIDHMTPPFDKASMNKELRELNGLINDYMIAKEKSPSLAESKLDEITTLSEKIGLLKDLGLKVEDSRLKAEDIEKIEEYIKEISEKQTPFGLHTFGKSPEERYRRSTAEAILSIEKGLSKEDRERLVADYEKRIAQSGKIELDSFISALSGKYIRAGQGNDPIRNPDSLPTGKNFYSFDPTKIPSKATYEIGMKLAKELIDGYKQRHGVFPDKLTFILWAVETIRHEGVMESQIMHLMGIRPRWDERGRVQGVETISRQELGRGRIDVTIVPSGLYRDMFSILMALLDMAVSKAKEQTEDDNLIRQNVLKTKKMLIEKGFDNEMAERLATVRIFTEPTGAYGTGLDNVIVKSDTWEDERKVIDVFFNRVGYLFGQGFWGDKIVQQSDSATDRQENRIKDGKSGREEEQKTENISLILFKNALSGTKIAIHSRASNLISTLDNDDVYQYLGGIAMAVRTIDGKTPEVYITNLSNPKQPKQETLEKVMGREMRSRYLNPEWIKAMMKEGYAGARFIDKVVEHLWGWQVVVPEVVDKAKWDEMYETYVLDRNKLNIKELFRDAKNMWAYQSIVARMLETVRKNYWKTDKDVIETLAKEYAESVREVGLACCDHTCNNPLLTKFTASVLMSVPGTKNEASGFIKALDRVQNPPSNKPSSSHLKSSASISQTKPAPDGSSQKVEGYEMQDMNAAGASSAPIPYLYIIGFIAFISLIMWGWRRRR